MSIAEEAEQFARSNKRSISRMICNVEIYVPSPNPFTMFMAGSPGSGKTEFSKALIPEIEQKDPEHKIIRLDTDELRERIPSYVGTNSDEVQRATTIIFDAVYDLAQNNRQNLMVDTTFSSPRAIDNLRRALGRDRSVGITFLYQNPEIAWEYTKKREKLEGRTVPKNVFINAYFESRENVEKIKSEFGDKVNLSLFIKDKDHRPRKTYFNIQTMRGYIKELYTKEDLEKCLPDEL